MERLAKLVNGGGHAIKLQVIKSLSMLVHNISNNKNFHCVVVKNSLHGILQYKAHPSDEEYA